MKESSKFKDSNYLIVFGWMVNQLELKGNDLLIFALIFGFTQDGMSKFNGSLQYMADATNSTIRGVQKNLKSLLDRNLIVKEDYSERDITLCKYYVSPEILDKFSAYEQSSRVWNKVLGGIEQSSRGYRTEFQGGIELSSNNNINNTIEDIKEDKKNECKKKDGTNASYKEIIDSFTINDDMKDTIWEFIKMRRLIKAPMTDKALRDMLSKLRRLADTESEQMEILNQSIMNSWKGIFAIKKEKKNVRLF